jgi:heat shock protein HtpX
VNVIMVEDRKEKNRQALTALNRWSAMVYGAPALVVAVILAILTRNLLLAILTAVVVFGALATWVTLSVRGFAATLLTQRGLTPADEQQYARFHNLTEGLCVAHGLTKPLLFVVPTEARNACTFAGGDRETKQAAVVLTTGAIEAFSRMELEGLLAQQLSHLRDGDTELSTCVAAMASVPGVGPLLARRAAASLDPMLELTADLGGVAMTRYPPGLAGALGKLVDHSTAVEGVTPVTAHLWLANPIPAASDSVGGHGANGAVVAGGAVGSSASHALVPHPPLADRIAVLNEL